MGEFMDILVDEAKKYRKKRQRRQILPYRYGEMIEERLVTILISPFVDQVTIKLRHDEEAIKKLHHALNDFIPDAMASIKRNGHMNTANGSGILDEEHADALLVSFVNFASMPCDLALYTSDLLTK